MNKKYIISKNIEIEKIIKTGKKISNKYLLIFYKENKSNFNRYCISIGKKLGNAVARNKIKRQIKDILMKNQLCFSKDYVIIIRKDLISLNYQEKREELIKKLKETI